MDDVFGYWLAGFLDGEASFNIDRRPPSAHDPYERFSCRLALVLRVDDRQIVEEIHARTGLGLVAEKAAQPRGHSMSAPQIGWHVRSKMDCVALVALLDRYPLRSKKAADYRVWRQAVLAWAEMENRLRRPGKGWARIDWEPIARLRDELHAGRRRHVVA